MTQHHEFIKKLAISTHSNIYLLALNTFQLSTVAPKAAMFMMKFLIYSEDSRQQRNSQNNKKYKGLMLFKASLMTEMQWPMQSTIGLVHIDCVTETDLQIERWCLQKMVMDKRALFLGHLI